MQISVEKQAVIDQTLALLIPIRGVQAVVLGGSHARGAAHAGSDLDIGIYYSENDPFAIEDIRAAAVALSGDPAQQVTGFYGWGAWVNGGGWIHTPVCKVDFLYRSLEHVQRAIRAAVQGQTEHDFDQQPAYGFYSVIYLAETSICHCLYDPCGHIARLKAQVETYPNALKQKTVASTLWMAEFSLMHADGYAAAGDVYATVGALTRTASFMTQALFAINETYFMSDKAALGDMAVFRLIPEAYQARLGNLLGQAGRSSVELRASVEALRGLWSDVVALTGGSYQPAFRV